MKKIYFGKTEVIKLTDVKAGDRVTRFLAGVPMELLVTNVTNDRIICSLWEFDPVTGAEIDDDLGWGPPPRFTGSFIIPIADLDA